MRLSWAVLLVFASLVTAAQRPTIATLLAEAEKVHEKDAKAAGQLLDRALLLPRLAGDGPMRAKVYVKKCWWSTDVAAARAAANAGLAEAARVNDQGRTARLLSCRGNSFENAGEIDSAAQDYAAARAAAEQGGDREATVDALVQSGYLRYSRGEMNDALVEVQKGYELAGSMHYDVGRRTALSYIAHIYADASVAQYDKALEYYRQLLPENEAHGSRESVSDTVFNIGSTYERKGDLQSALSWYRRGLRAEEELGREEEVAYVKRSIGSTLVKLGRPAEGLPMFEEALATYRKNGSDAPLAQVRESRGIAYRRLGRLDEAIADLEASRKYFAGIKNLRFLEKSQDELALAYAAAGRWEDAYRARKADAELQRELAEKLREQHTSRLRIQFDSEKKEQENRALERQKSMQQQRNRALERGKALRDRALEAADRIDRLQKTVLALSALIIVVLIYLVVGHVRDARRIMTMALTDELTRLPNRRRIVAVGDDLLKLAGAHGTPFSVIAFDIDYFKRVNDTFGHPTGDTVLQRVAHACRITVRPTDHIGRVGGEEFTVLLPSTKLHEALQVAERLRVAVESLDFTSVESSLHVTISLGVAEWTPADTTLAKIIGRADEVLYRAKASGRNRVERAVA
jgi:diguanylate cyclase (GGDEF)-like protein